MNDGIYPNLSFDEYVKADAVSSSMLRLMIQRSPAHLEAFQASKPTLAKRLGTLAHARITGEYFTFPLAVKPKGLSFSSNKGKAWRDSVKGAQIISQSESDFLDSAINSILEHPFARRLFETGSGEVSLFWTPQEMIQCKARLDWNPIGDVIVDFKTCEDASPEGFRRMVRRYRYDIQSEWYKYVANGLQLKKEHFVFICIEKLPPYAVACYQLGLKERQKASGEAINAFIKVAHCREYNRFPAYSENCEVISL